MMDSDGNQCRFTDHSHITLMTLTEESSDQRINSLIINILVGVTMILKEVNIIIEELVDSYW